LRSLFLRRIAEATIKEGELLEVTLSDRTKWRVHGAKEVKFLREDWALHQMVIVFCHNSGNNSSDNIVFVARV